MPRSAEFHAPEDFAMKAVIIYDELGAAAGAKLALQNSARMMNPAAEWKIATWQVDMLKIQRMAEEAMTDSLNAYLVLITSRRAQLLPAWLQNWLEHWAKCRHIEGAAVALLGAGHSDLVEASKIQELPRFAGRDDWGLLCGDDQNGKDRSGAVEQFWDRRRALPSGALQPILNTPILEAHRFWGIND